MRKILINTAVGGFDIGKEIFYKMVELNHPEALEEKDIIEGLDITFREGFIYYGCFIKRDDPLLIELFESMKTTKYKLKIIEIQEEINWYIYQSDDGREAVHEEHNVWQ